MKRLTTGSTVSLFAILFLVFALMNRDLISGWFSHVTPAPADSIRGEWVGKMQISGIYDPNLRDIQKDAVIRFNLNVTDSFLKKYGGSGELTIAGETPQTIEIRDLWPETSPGDNTLRAGIWLDGPTRDNDPISGEFKGTFEPGILSLKRTINVSLGYVMQGVLHKGTDAEYEALLKQMTQQSNAEK
ncbi:hypothetical protein [Granulicella mallensis]|uniref:Uncharacterized protein n=1 Tax=Granulicella mallensis (strain ATCC BAA-1857 / DSM 23137 / MP5ACTX8) TaxID=682795 RepID=G8NRN5_GRAMM|nr:hypothetical protein [Granulicella mallensis]AEU38476.1 hypothetical protein AciX8_4197 [Granulicella mallensis MP5ACTX8]